MNNHIINAYFWILHQPIRKRKRFTTTTTSPTGLCSSNTNFFIRKSIDSSKLCRSRDDVCFCLRNQVRNLTFREFCRKFFLLFCNPVCVFFKKYIYLFLRHKKWSFYLNHSVSIHSQGKWFSKRFFYRDILKNTIHCAYFLFDHLYKQYKLLVYNSFFLHIFLLFRYAVLSSDEWKSSPAYYK